MVALTVALIVVMAASSSVATVTAFTPTYYTSSPPIPILATGSTFVNPLMQTWVAAYSTLTAGVTISYTATSSGVGLSSIEANTVGFGASDAPVPPSTITSYTGAPNNFGPLLEIPEALGGVAIMYNIPGVSSVIHLTGAQVANIFDGTYSNWDQLTGTGVTMPNHAITIVHRGDSSGTTYILTNFFTKVSTTWNSAYEAVEGGGYTCTGAPNYAPTPTPCYAKSPPVGVWDHYNPGGTVLAPSGSPNVAQAVKTNPYSIGYADNFYAFSNHILAAAIENSAGIYTTPTLASITAAANADEMQTQNNPLFTTTNAPGTASYPIASYTYILIWQNQAPVYTGSNNAAQQCEQAQDLAQFFWWMVNQGQTYGPSLGYPPLPVSVVAIDEGLIEQLNCAGTPFISAASAATTTTPTCLSNTIALGTTTTCTAQVDFGPFSTSTTQPTGTVTWSFTGSGAVTFSTLTCTLSVFNSTASVCSVTIKGTKLGTPTITAAYSGDNYNAPSSGTVVPTITKSPTTLTLTCNHNSVFLTNRITCTATVVGFKPMSPLGQVIWTQSTTNTGKVGFASLAHPNPVKNTFICTLNPQGWCAVSVKGTFVGTLTISAQYTGNGNNNPSLPKTLGLTVKP